MAKLFGLTAKDVAATADAIQRIRAGTGNNRPIARRRRFAFNDSVAYTPLLIAKTKVAVLADDQHFTVEQLSAFQGSIPTKPGPDDTTIPVTTLSVENLFKWTLDQGATVLIARGLGNASDPGAEGYVEGQMWIAVQGECPE
jgi:hypothetical protein